MVRLCHASKKTLRINNTLENLMLDGHLDLDDKDIKWEKHRSMGKSWLETINPWNGVYLTWQHGNIRGFAASDPGIENMISYMEMLLQGVEGGKQFPFRYITAYNQLNQFEKQELIVEDLEEEKYKKLNPEIKENIMILLLILHTKMLYLNI